MEKKYRNETVIVGIHYTEQFKQKGGIVKGSVY